MPITFGSVGDVISVSLLIKDLYKALDSAKGSAADYQAVVRELNVLDTALLHVEQLSRTNAPTPELHALYETAKRSVDKCRISVDSFTKGIRRYGGSLKQGGSGNPVRDVARRLKWEVCEKDEVTRFRAEIAGYSDSINMLVNTANVALLKVANADVNESIEKSTVQTQASLDRQDEKLKNIQDRLEDTKQLILTGNSITRKVTDRLEWFRKLGTDLKSYMFSIIASNLRIYHEVVAIRTAVAQIGRPLAEDPFMLEDAIGRFFPVHLRFITSWEAFESVMELNFRGRRGFNKVQKKDYVLHDNATNKEIPRAQDWEDAFLPGQKVDMSLVFKNEVTGDEECDFASCPHCHHVSQEPADTNIQCTKCKRWFCRVVEVCEVEVPEPPQSFQVTVRHRENVRFGEASLKNEKPMYGPAAPPMTPSRSPPAASPKESVQLEEDNGDITGINRIHFLTRRIRYKSCGAFTSFATSNPFQSLKDVSQPSIFENGDWVGWKFPAADAPAPCVEDEEASGVEDMDIQEDHEAESDHENQSDERMSEKVENAEPIQSPKDNYVLDYTPCRSFYSFYHHDESPYHSRYVASARQESVLKNRRHTRQATQVPADFTYASRTPSHFCSPADIYSKTSRSTKETGRPHRRYVFADNADAADRAPPPYTTYTNIYEYELYGSVSQSRPRYRRASHTPRPNSTTHKTSEYKTVPSNSSCKATEEDARRAGIPHGYSFKNWDPQEEPLTLLGSVFDANSLGKWIYDWTVFNQGAATPMSDLAGDCWLLLIQLAGKIKRADEGIVNIFGREDCEVVEDFLESGERLWVRFKKLLRTCEEYMWKAAKKGNGSERPTTVGKNSGCEFVDTIFGRDRELDKTEKLMSAIRLWSMRFDANCNEILQVAQTARKGAESARREPLEEDKTDKEDAMEKVPEETSSSVQPENPDVCEPAVLGTSLKRKLEESSRDIHAIGPKRQHTSMDELIPANTNSVFEAEIVSEGKDHLDSQNALKRKAEETLRTEDGDENKRNKIAVE